MPLNQTNKLVWIVETIYRAHKITFEELNRRWMDNVDDMKSGSVENWLLSTLSVSNSLLECKSIKDRIILEDVPSGREYLEPIIDAMKKNRFIHINYFNYWKGESRNHYLMPLCVKLFRQRWYMVGRNWPAGRDIVFCLDRIQDIRLSSHTFEYPEEFDPQEYFNGCIGVIPGDGCDIEKIKIKVSANQANYLRDLPLHHSQQEIEQSAEYSIFELHVRPTYDFQQELFWNGEDLEVLEPLWLRKEIALMINRMCNKYN